MSFIGMSGIFRRRKTKKPLPQASSLWGREMIEVSHLKRTPEEEYRDGKLLSTTTYLHEWDSEGKYIQVKKIEKNIYDDDGTPVAVTTMTYHDGKLQSTITQSTTEGLEKIIRVAGLG